MTATVHPPHHCSSLYEIGSPDQTLCFFRDISVSTDRCLAIAIAIVIANHRHCRCVQIPSASRIPALCSANLPHSSRSARGLVAPSGRSIGRRFAEGILCRHAASLNAASCGCARSCWQRRRSGHVEHMLMSMQHFVLQIVGYATKTVLVRGLSSTHPHSFGDRNFPLPSAVLDRATTKHQYVSTLLPDPAPSNPVFA